MNYASAMDVMVRVAARRLARIAFGATLLVGATRLAITHATASGHGAASTLASIWLRGLVFATLAYVTVRLTRWSPPPHRLFTTSAILPVAGIGLLAPLTLHLPIVRLIGGAEWPDIWVTATIWLMSPALVLFAILAAVRAWQLVAGRPAVRSWAVFGITAITACVPSFLGCIEKPTALWLIPPALGALTAVVFVPLLNLMERWISRERAEIAAIPAQLPRAVARR